MRVLVPVDFTPLDAPLPPVLPQALGDVTYGLAAFWVAENGTELRMHDERGLHRYGSIDAWEAWTKHEAVHDRLPQALLHGEEALVIATRGLQDISAWTAPVASACSWIRAHTSRQHFRHASSRETGSAPTSRATLSDIYLKEIEKIREEQHLILELEDWLDRHREPERSGR